MPRLSLREVLVWIPDTGDVNKVTTRLRKQIAGLKTEERLVMSRKVTEKGQTLALLTRTHIKSWRERN